MHSLHRILVYIPDVGDVNTVTKNDIRGFAEDATESFYEAVFDWRQTNSAGRWSDARPENVVLAKDNVEFFKDELTSSIERQVYEIQGYIDHLREYMGDKDLIAALQEHLEEGFDKPARLGPPKKGEGHINDYVLYLLEQAVSMMRGKYTFDIGFYDTHNGISHITTEDVEAIVNNPSDWAMVYFDYHL